MQCEALEREEGRGGIYVYVYSFGWVSSKKANDEWSRIQHSCYEQCTAATCSVKLTIGQLEVHMLWHFVVYDVMCQKCECIVMLAMVHLEV